MKALTFSPVALWLALLTGASSVACKRNGSAESHPSASAAPVRAASAAAVSAPAPAVSVNAPSPEKLAPLERARAVVNAWDAALNQHDTAALAPLYSANVTYYGQSVTRDKLLESKRKALAATPRYAQSLSSVTLEAEANGNVQVSFRKRSGAPNAQSSVQARLSLEKQGDGYAIALESDAPSDTRADDATRSCIDVAMDVANGLPEVEKLFNEAGPDAREGGLMYPEEDGHVGAAMGFHHDDRFETVFNVDVDTTSGALTVAEYGTPLKIPKAGLERVRTKCKKASP